MKHGIEQSSGSGAADIASAPGAAEGGDRGWEIALAAVAWSLLALLAVLPLWLIHLRVPLNYNEGWNAYFADAALHGGVLYPPADALFANNYPPLSFYLVDALGRLLGDNIVAGRCLSFAAVLALGAAIHGLCRWLGAAPRPAALGTAQILLALYILRPPAMAMNDPQFLAQACASWATLLMLRAPGYAILKSTTFAAVLLIVGGLIKHSVIAAPFALCIWLALHDRRRLSGGAPVDFR